MTLATTERPVPSGYPADRPGGEVSPLHMELYLTAHDDDTGRAHIDTDTLVRGLAAAVFLELWLTGRVHIGWAFNARAGRYEPDPGRVIFNNPEPTGDPITDSALIMLWQTGGPHYIGDVIERFATIDLYQRVRAAMIARGVLRTATRRRWWFLRSTVHRPAHIAHPVRVRSRIRQLAAARRHPDARTLALAGLVTGLELTPYLYSFETTTVRLQGRLRALINQQSDATIRDISMTLSPRNATV